MPWDDFPPASRSWNFHLNSLELLDAVLGAHSATKEVHYLKPAVRVALDWVEKHPRIDPAQGAHAWYDMAVGMRAYRLAYVVDAAAREDWLTDQQMQDLRDSLELHRSELADDAKICFSQQPRLLSNRPGETLALMARRFGAFSRAHARRAGASQTALADDAPISSSPPRAFTPSTFSRLPPHGAATR